MRYGVLPLALIWLLACSDEQLNRIPPGIALEDEEGDALVELEFGEVPVDDEAEEVVFVRSIRASQLEVKRAEIVGDDAESFAVEGGGFLVGGGKREPLAVRFAPRKVGDLSATLVVHSDDADNPKVEVALGGRGIDSAIRVEACLSPTEEDPELCAKTLVVAPEPLDLGQVVAGTPRNARVTVTNLGRKPLELESISFEKPEQAEAWGFTLPARAGDGQTIGGLSSGGLTLGFHPPSGLAEEVEIALIIKSSDRSQAELRLPVFAEVLPNAPPEVCLRVKEAQTWDGKKLTFEAGERVVISPGDTLIFDARVREGCTADPEDGEEIELEWSVEGEGGFAFEVVPDLDPFEASFQADTIGSYLVSLTATDSIGQVGDGDAKGVPASLEFWVEPQTDIGVEIRWPKAPDVDLDVHLVRGQGREGIFGSEDFYWDNLDLNWGSNPPLSNPHLVMDDKGSLMVETMLLNAPEEGQRYSILVHMQRDARERIGEECGPMNPCGGGEACSLTSDEAGICMPPVEVSARLFVLKEEVELSIKSASLGSACETWHVGDVVWTDPPTVEPGLSVIVVEGDGVRDATCYLD